MDCKAMLVILPSYCLRLDSAFFVGFFIPQRSDSLHGPGSGRNRQVGFHLPLIFPIATDGEQFGLRVFQPSELSGNLT